VVFNATFNNISAISWWSVLMVEETRVPGENYQPAESNCKTLSHKVVSISSTQHHIPTPLENFHDLKLSK
jgi:hypothetical protein